VRCGAKLGPDRQRGGRTSRSTAETENSDSDRRLDSPHSARPPHTETLTLPRLLLTSSSYSIHPSSYATVAKCESPTSTTTTIRNGTLRHEQL